MKPRKKTNKWPYYRCSKNVRDLNHGSVFRPVGSMLLVSKEEKGLLPGATVCLALFSGRKAAGRQDFMHMIARLSINKDI